MDIGDICFVLFNQDAVKSQVLRGLSGPADASKWIKHDATGRCNQLHKPFEKADRLNCGMSTAGAFGVRRLGAIKEPCLGVQSADFRSPKWAKMRITSSEPSCAILAGRAPTSRRAGS